MSITVGMSDLLRRVAGWQEPVELPVCTPLECLKKITLQFPILNKWLYDEQDKIKSHVWLMVNDERIYKDEFAIPLHDGDHLLIMVAIMGG